MKNNFYKDLKNILNQNIAYTVLFLLSIVSFIWLYVTEIPEEYKMIMWAPLAYAFGLILFVRPNKLMGIASLSVCILYFVKLCVDPITSVLGQFFSIVDRNIVLTNWNHACVLLAFEWIIVAFTIWLRSPIYSKRLAEAVPEKNVGNHSQLKFWGVLFCGISFAIYLMFPRVRNLLCFIWQEDKSALAANSGPFLYLFKIFFEIGKPIFLFWLYWKIDLIRSSAKRRAGQILLIGITFALVSDYRIMSLLEATAMLLVFLQNNIKKKCEKAIIKATFLIVALYCVFLLTTHNDVRNKSLVNLCRLMDIYTGGFMTATAGLNVKFNNGISMFFHDIYNGSYILVGVFGRLYSTTDAINAAINASAKGIFFESIIQARAMFGSFYPLAIVFLADFVIRMDFYSVKTTDILYKVIYVMCGFTAAVFMIMYTYTMIINFIIYKAFVWLLFTWIDKHIRLTWHGRRII